MSTIHTNISKSAPTTYWAVAILKYRPKCDDELCLTTQQAVEVNLQLFMLVNINLSDFIELFFH